VKKSIPDLDKKVSDLLESALGQISLKILVFGPQVKPASSDTRTRHLQEKRVEIRQALEQDGHWVKYAEDLVDPNLTGPMANALLQEMVIMAEYDLIVVLVGSPGSIVETTAIASKTHLARKSALYLDFDHRAGLVAQACELAKHLGAFYTTYEYPKDLIECHLLGHVTERAKHFKLIKYMS
jgi:hypothetical protein